MARALDLHSRGQGFDSLILHKDGDGRTEYRARWLSEAEAREHGVQNPVAERSRSPGARRTETGDGKKKRLKRRAEAKKQKVHKILKIRQAGRSQE